MAASLRDLIDAGVVTIRRRSAVATTWAEPRGYIEPRTVVLVGTSHVSSASAADVARVIAATRPAAVVVELCRSRAGLLDEPSPPPSSAAATGAVGQRTGRSGAGGGGIKGGALALGGDRGAAAAALGRSLRLGGNSALALRLALAAVLGRASATTAEGGSGGGASAVAPVGVDFRAARAAAAAVGAQVVLGDRPVEITLRRSWAALGFVDRLRLVWLLLRGGLGGGVGGATVPTASPSAAPLSRNLAAPSAPPGADVVPDVAAAVDAAASARLSDDALDAFLAALAASFPSLVPPLVTERDLYLAWSVKRSQAVKGVDTVVGVIGRAHCRGVLAAMDEDDAARAGGGVLLTFRDLVG